MTEDPAAPVVSVVIPAHNAEDVLPRCLSSLASQSWNSFEVVLVDDGSTDRTVEVVSDFEATFPLVLLRQTNSGPPAARNRGAQEARGTFLTFLDSDDEVHPEWLGTLASLAQPCDAGVACCGAEVVDIHDHSRVDWLPEDLGPAFFSQEAMFLPGGYLLRRDLFFEAGGFAEIEFGEHHELGLRLTRRLAEDGLRICTTPGKLVTKYHDRSPERVTEYDPGRLRGARYNLDVHGRQLARDPDLLADYHAIAGVAAIRLGMPRDARVHFGAAARASGWSRKHLLRFLLSRVPGLRTLFWRRWDWLDHAVRR